VACSWWWTGGRERTNGPTLTPVLFSLAAGRRAATVCREKDETNFFLFNFDLTGSTPTSNANERYELGHGGSKSTESDSPKSSSHDDSASGTPDPTMGGGGSSKHLSHRGTPDGHDHGHSGGGGGVLGGGSPGSMVVSSASGFPPHFSSLASYYSQLNQVQGLQGAHGTTLSPSLAHMAQYGHAPLPAGGQNPYAPLAHHPNPGSAPSGGPSANNDFRRALPVIF